MKLSSKTQTISLPTEITKLVVLGDPHGGVKALQTVLEKEGGPNTSFVSVGDNIGYASAMDCSHLIDLLKTNNIPSVWGNHEEWSDDSGRMFLISDPSQSRILSKEAVEWCQNLPLQINFDLKAAPDLSIKLKHSIYDRDSKKWDWITPENVEIFAKINCDIIFTGHSHAARLYSLNRLNAHWNLSSFYELDVMADDSITMNIQKGLKYVVDSGSINRPEGGAPPFDRGSYAVLDLLKRTVQIKSFKKKD